MEGENLSCKIVYIEKMLDDNDSRKTNSDWQMHGRYAEHVLLGDGTETYICNNRPAAIQPGELVKVLPVGRYYKEVIDEENL